MNGNELARRITLKEGKKVSLPIGQVKEVIRLVRLDLKRQSDAEVIRWVRR